MKSKRNNHSKMHEHLLKVKRVVRKYAEQRQMDTESYIVNSALGKLPELPPSNWPINPKDAIMFEFKLLDLINEGLRMERKREKNDN